MTRRQFCTPHIVSGSNAVALEPVALGDRSRHEDWYQRMLFENPSLLPVGDIEPAFEPLTPLARELQTGKGPVDIVYINPEGYITLVETKLWRNPDARRAVVAQIIEYATGMAKWTYADLRDAVQSIRRDTHGPSAAGRLIGPGDDPIIALVQDQPGFDEARFTDSVTRNLRTGRFLLLIVGNGIKEGVEDLTEALQGSPHLGYTLALVEMAVYKLADDDGKVLVQPRVLTRTRELVRHVIEVRNAHPTATVSVTPAVIDGGGDPRPRSITEVAFFEQLEKNAGAPVAEFARWLVGEVERTADLHLTWSKAGPAIWWDDDSGERQAGLLRLRASGEFSSTNWLPSFCAANGLPMSIADSFQNGLLKLVPGARRVEHGSLGHTQVRDEGGAFPKLAPLASRRDEFWTLLRGASRALAEALAVRDEKLTA